MGLASVATDLKRSTRICKILIKEVGQSLASLPPSKPTHQVVVWLVDPKSTQQANEPSPRRCTFFKKKILSRNVWKTGHAPRPNEACAEGVLSSSHQRPGQLNKIATTGESEMPTCPYTGTCARSEPATSDPSSVVEKLSHQKCHL